MMPFFCIRISHGSVATCLKRGGILCCKFTTESASEKNCENRIIVSEVMAKSLVSCFFSHSRCSLNMTLPAAAARQPAAIDRQPVGGSGSSTSVCPVDRTDGRTSICYINLSPHTMLSCWQRR